MARSRTALRTIVAIDEERDAEERPIPERARSRHALRRRNALSRVAPRACDVDFPPLSERIEHFPLILAGPMVRRVQSDSVTVWVALRLRRMVQLEIHELNPDGTSARV